MGVRTTEQVKLSVEHADVAVMCLGLDATIEGEQGDAGNEYASGDKLGLNLPGLQEELLETVAAMGKPVVVLLMAGSAIDHAMGGTQPECESHRGLLVSGSQRW